MDLNSIDIREVVERVTKVYARIGMLHNLTVPVLSSHDADCRGD